MLLLCELLKRLVPRVGVEPTRPYGQRILSLTNPGFSSSSVFLLVPIP
jgi:hypothetical protein